MACDQNDKPQPQSETVLKNVILETNVKKAE